MIKRCFDILLSFVGLIVAGPALVPVMLLVWLQEFESPLYVAPRVGWNGRMFRMIKLRSMVVGADQSGVDSTSLGDPRITRVGRFIRAYKLDEIFQLWNVLKGDMSLVGPRPNVKRETDLYTNVEKKLLTVKPGITELSSIIFADEAEILKDSSDPNITYNQLVRPWKSRLSLLYIERQSLILDLHLIFLTIVGVFWRGAALAGVGRILRRLGASEASRRVARRDRPLVPTPPLGALHIVTTRDVAGGTAEDRAGSPREAIAEGSA